MNAHQISLLSPRCAERGDHFRMLTPHEAAAVDDARHALHAEAERLRVRGDFVIAVGGAV
jgi:hypothetical protein